MRELTWILSSNYQLVKCEHNTWWVKKVDAGWIIAKSIQQQKILIHSKMSAFSLLFCFCFCFFNQAADLDIQLSSTLRIKDFKVDKVSFGTIFTDHMLTIEWNVTEGCRLPSSSPLGTCHSPQAFHRYITAYRYRIHSLSLKYKEIWSGFGKITPQDKANNG